MSDRKTLRGNWTKLVEAYRMYLTCMNQQRLEQCLEDGTILGWEQDWVKRGIFEALCIRILNPSINIDPGRHTVSSHFDQILKEIIKPPPDPAPHNPDNETLINTAPRRQGRPRKNQPTPSPITDPPTRQSHSQPTENNGDQNPLPQRQSQRIRDRHNRQQPASQ